MSPLVAGSSVTGPTGRTGAVRPLPPAVALGRLVRCGVKTVALIARGRLHQPDTSVGERFGFADGTSAVVYRETVVDRRPMREPVLLAVEFRMWLLNGHRGQTFFRVVSLLNTLLFAGFPGFATKLWMAADEHGTYRGLYEWDGVGLADEYVRALWWPLAVISHPESIRYHMRPGRRRDEILSDGEPARGGGAWWQPIAVDPPPE